MQKLDSVVYERLEFWCQSMGNRHVAADFVRECDIVFVVGVVVYWERSVQFDVEHLVGEVLLNLSFSR